MLYAILKNKNWGKEGVSWQTMGNQGGRDSRHQSEHQSEHDKINEIQQKLVAFCAIPRTMLEMMNCIGLKSRSGFYRNYLKALIDSGLIVMTNPDNPRSKDQKYVAKD